ncbi:hypothetical protein [Rhodohalobacter sp. 8-1]|uniref:hypothetical protein n=1 Tax=Rhodohalobacter sp. 8-1 TaxID=3131972 RepID=UPI0030EE0DDB
MQSTLRNIGHYLYALPFAVFGLFHFMNAGSMAGMVPLPGGVFWVYFTGVALIAAAVSFVIGKKVRLAGTLLGIMLIIFVLSIHLPGTIGADNPQAMQMSMTSLLKDLALAGAAFYIAGSTTEENA